MTVLRTMTCLALLACTPASTPAGALDGGPTRSPEQTAEMLSGAAHGVSPLSGLEVMEMLEEAKRAPAAFVPLLRPHLSVEAIVGAPSQGLAELEAGNSAHVLAQLGEQGRAALATAWRALQVAVDEEERTLEERGRALGPGQHAELQARGTKVHQLLGVQRAVLYALASVGDARLRDDLLERFDTANHTVQLWFLDYCAATAKGDPKVKAKLRPYLQSPESPLRNSPRLRSLLEESTLFSCGGNP